MGVVSAAKIAQIARAADKKQGILDAVGDLSAVEVMFGHLLIGTYIGTGKIGSIILPEETTAENEWQSRVGLVLKMAPDCYLYDPGEDGQRVDVGDWVVINLGDTRGIHVNQAPCRIVPQGKVLMRIPDPTMVY